jgi:hypothetical protein
MRKKASVVLIDFAHSGHHQMYARAVESILRGSGFIVRSRIVPHDFLSICRSKGKFLSNIIFWKRLFEQIRPKEKEFLFFLYWDNPAAFWINRSIRRLFIKQKIGGIWMNTWGFRKRGGFCPVERAAKRYAFLNEKEVSLLVLDDAVSKQLSGVVRAKVSFLPELVDVTVHNSGEILKQLRKFKGTRKLILLIGMINGSKNVSLFLKVAKKLHGSRWAFAIIGEGASTSFFDELDVFPRDEILYIPRRVPTEGEYNSLILTADAVWGVYRNWEASSNLVSKAGLLKRPIIVADGYLNAERVRKYGLGYVVSEENEEDAARILLSWDTDNRGISYKKNPQFSEDFSMDAARTCLATFFGEFCSAPDDSAVKWLPGCVEIVARFLMQKMWNMLKALVSPRRGN